MRTAHRKKLVLVIVDVVGRERLYYQSRENYIPIMVQALKSDVSRLTQQGTYVVAGDVGFKGH